MSGKNPAGTIHQKKLCFVLIFAALWKKLYILRGYLWIF